MRRNELFTLRLNKTERVLIASLAEKLNRSQSDAVRFVVIMAAHELQKLRTQEAGHADCESCSPIRESIN